MEINGVYYRVLDISLEAQTLRIARKDYKSGICSPEYANTTINPELFDYSDGYQNLTFIYDCPSSPVLPVHFACPISNSVKYKDWSITAGANGPGACSASVVVPFPRKLNWTAMNNPSDLGQILKEGFVLAWKFGGVPCQDCANPEGSCGPDSGLNGTINWSCPPTSALPDEGPIGITAAVVGIIIILSIFLISRPGRSCTLDKVMVSLKKKTEDDQNIEAFVKNVRSLALRKYNYSDVKRMTKSFSNKLGQGGYGDVYRGKLPDGRLVAVKFLKQSKGNGEEFINEVASISRTSHVNIVALLGFCYERKKRALIYEFIPNGSLDKFIYDEKSSSTNFNLEWKTMYQIVVGIARGLEYLHPGCNTRIMHFDIKPHNILLDEDFCPKIADFGLAKLCKKKESMISMLGARGTIGYIAPEVFCRTFGEVSHKSDVYSYGMMILEMVGGRKNIDVGVFHTSEIYFPNWIYKQLEPGKDFEFHGVVTVEEKELAKKMILVSFEIYFPNWIYKQIEPGKEFEFQDVVTEDEKVIAKKMIIVSMWCIQTIPSNRPSMSKVLEMLEGSLESMQIPPRPFLSLPARSTIPLSSFSTPTSLHIPASLEEICIDLSDM
ncbi:hypothetical protein ACOSQ4_026481 [Xanthoceras sorbifolium]